MITVLGHRDGRTQRVELNDSLCLAPGSPGWSLGWPRTVSTVITGGILAAFRSRDWV